VNKVLVTGATGFLGRHLIKKLKEKASEIYISNTAEANLSNVENLYIYNSIKFDYIFHLAAVTKAGDYCVKHPADQWIQNQTINTNILKYWKEFQPQAKMICMGTSCSYSPDLYMTEDNYLLGPPEQSLYTYAMTKRMLLVGLQSIQQQYGLEWLYFVPSTLYGPDFELDDNHFIFDFIRNCYNAKYNNEKFVLWGDGEQRRELVYVDDAVNIMIKLLEEKNEVFNLGTGQDYTINEFAQEVCKIYDYNFDLVEHDLTKYVGAKQKKIDIDKISCYLDQENFMPTSLEVGLSESIQYFKENI
jgi:GDP-L-fucose synthase